MVEKGQSHKDIQSFPLLALLVLLIGPVANDQTAVLAARPSQEEPPLRLSEPTEAIVFSLEPTWPARVLSSARHCLGKSHH
jgi:hypothetical protein